ncbi:MAG: bilirubin oxidase, partial [Terrabacter sp.]
MSRRTFVKAVGGAGIGFALYAYLPGGDRVAVAQVPGGTLDPATIPKFVTALVIPPVMARAGTIKQVVGPPIDYYEVSQRQFEQQILPPGLPATTVWGYGSLSSDSKQGVLLHHAPSPTIEAEHGRPVRVKWVNELVDGRGRYLPHLLTVDPTLHWANPPGGTAGRDSRPVFKKTPDPYAGPVPMVVHLHGAVGVGDESDGYPEAWFLPVATNLPSGYAAKGSWYDFFAGKAKAGYGATWGPGFSVYQ